MLKIGFIGAGRVGNMLATALTRKGYEVRAVTSRSRRSAESLAASLPSQPKVFGTPQEVADLCDLVFITTPDDAIAEVASRVQWGPGHRVAHCSGALSVEVLEPVSRAGGGAGTFHPLQSFAAREDNALDGVTIALEGDVVMLPLLQQIVSTLGARWTVIPSGSKALYHVSGVLVSNYVVALVRAAMELWEEMGIPAMEAQEALLPLLRGTADNIQRLGIPAALTGPIARGDLGTVARHLDELEDKAPALAGIYRELGRLTVPIAEAKGTIDETTAHRLLALLQEKQISREEAPVSLQGVRS